MVDDRDANRSIFPLRCNHNDFVPITMTGCHHLQDRVADMVLGGCRCHLLEIVLLVIVLDHRDRVRQTNLLRQALEVIVQDLPAFWQNELGSHHAVIEDKLHHLAILLLRVLLKTGEVLIRRTEIVRTFHSFSCCRLGQR
ncbi:hypothetical protein D3C74_380850 [compost metagenome]